MNVNYAKTMLYAYGEIEEEIEVIKSTKLNKALLFVDNRTPCINQCEEILSMGDEEKILCELLDILEKVMKQFNEEEYKYFAYKYFREQLKGQEIDFDTNSRQYFRTQVRLAIKFAKALERVGLSDKIMRKEYLKIDFLNEIYQEVLENEKANKKKGWANDEKKIVV